MKRVRFLAAIVVTASAMFAGAVSAQPYPNRPIRFVVPYAAGGLPDVVARAVSIRLGEALGQSVVVDNRPGANGAVAAANIASSPADGYTFLVTDGSMMTISPLLSSKLPYDPAKDFVPVSLIAQSPLFLAVHPSVPVNSLTELVALAKAKPAAMNYGSSGIGSTHHLSMEAMKSGFGIYITHIPFRGSAASVPAMIGGQVEMVFSAYPSLAGFVKNGQAKILATNSAKRSGLAPNVPAISESIPGFDFAVIVVVMAKTGTPSEVIARVSSEIAKIAKQQEFIDRMQIAGIDTIGGDPAALATALREESKRVTAAAKRANLKAE